MKISKNKLKKLVEAFISGPHGTVNLDAEPYEFMKHHPDPQVSKLAKVSPQYAKQAAMLSGRKGDPLDDFEKAEYEEEIRNDPAFNPNQYNTGWSSNVTDVYSRMMSLYDSDPNFEENLKERVFNYIGNSKDLTNKKRIATLQKTADTLADMYFEDGFFDVEGILTFEAETFLKNLAKSDKRLKMGYANYGNQLALNQKGRKSLEQIIEKAFEESGLGDKLMDIYFLDYHDRA